MGSMTPEGKVKEKVKKILKKRGVWFFMPRGSTFGTAGVADIICCHEGRLLAIETKAGNNQPTKLQLNSLRSIVNHGGCALVVRESNMDAVEAALDFIERNHNSNFCWRGFDEEADGQSDS